ncbi:MAG: SUMF1/EgtB/PvdO family nonheme iron enzyme [Bdellovibrionales bacterium]|nr:SUMF1/EgtB/PvdO family nonheme iron enzyme [Bdellovibrionales bacterium]
MTFLQVPHGNYQVGTTWEGVISCVEQWKTRLINPCYDELKFRDWIAKEFPAYYTQSDAFEMQQTLVSNADVGAFIAETEAQIPESILTGEPCNHPVWGVSLQWARAFAAWLTQKDKHFQYRLPSETEWEVAARGLDFREFPYGDQFNAECANTIESGWGKTTPIDHFAQWPGPFGHWDLAGNVEEWVDSQYFVYPGGRVIKDDLYERFKMDYSILRGGSFACGGDLSRGARRHGPFPDPLFRYTGFRLVRTRPGGRAFYF